VRHEREVGRQHLDVRDVRQREAVAQQAVVYLRLQAVDPFVSQRTATNNWLPIVLQKKKIKRGLSEQVLSPRQHTVPIIDPC